MRSVYRGLLAVAIGAAVLSGCTGDSPAKKFYAHPRSQWGENLEHLPPDQQWRVYLYGVQTMEPPPFELAVVLAKNRGSILPEVIETVEKSHRKADLQSVSAVLQMMREVVHYDYCAYRPFRAPEFEILLRQKLAEGAIYACPWTAGGTSR